MSIYDSHTLTKHRALFEAWLTGGIPIREKETYKVLSMDEAKKKLKEFIKKENYIAAKDLAERLTSSISFSDKKISKSYRIPFIVYVKLVKLAFKQGIELSGVIERRVKEDIKRIVGILSKREDIIEERLKFLQKTIQTWEPELVRKTRIYINEMPFTYVSKEYYPLIPALKMPKEIAESCVNKAIEEFKDKCLSIPGISSEAVERCLNLIDIKQLSNDLMDDPQPITIEFSQRKDGKIGLSVYCEKLVDLKIDEKEMIAFEEEMRSEFGKEVVDGIVNFQEGFFTDGTFYLYIELFSGIIDVKGDKLLLNNVIISHEAKDQTNSKLKLLSKFDETINQLKSELDYAVKKDKFDKVAEISGKLAAICRDRKLADFALDILFRLLRGKTQVISFRAPEVIIRAWNAYGNTNLNQVLTMEVEE